MLLTVATARADQFTLDSYTVNLHEIDPGLVLWENALLGTPKNFQLNTAGDTVTFDLFQIGTNETALNLDDLVPYGIDVQFDFSSPPPGFGGSTNGISGAGWFFGSFGYVVWDNPLILSYGTSGRMAVNLTNVTFGLPGSSTVRAQFTLVEADKPVSPSSVPEPAISVLLSVGMIAFGLVRRRVR